MVWFQEYVALLPAFVLSWKLYGALAICLALESLFFVMRRPLLTKELAQDFLFGAVKHWLFVPFLVFYTALYASFFETYLPFLRWGVAESWPLWLQGGVGFLAADLMLYLTHLLKHKVRALWYFHTVHHSQRNLNPLTTHRTHVGEDLVEDPIQFLPLAILGVGYPTWVGIRAANWLWAHVIHSNLRWDLGPLRRVFVSPQYHRIHHSIERRHQDRNFGERLVLWDWLFGTLHRAEKGEYPRTGVDEPSYPLETSSRGFDLPRQLLAQYLYPFRMLWRDARRSAHRQGGTS